MDNECKPLSFHEFDKAYNMVVKEIGIKEDGTVASHNLYPNLWVESMDPKDTYEYEVVGVEPTIMMGCGCWDGVIIRISRTEEEN